LLAGFTEWGLAWYETTAGKAGIVGAVGAAGYAASKMK